MTRIAELKLTLLDRRPCKELLAQLEQSLQRMRFRIQDRQDNTSDGTVTLKTVEQARWWNSEVGSRLPIWIELELQPAARGTRVQVAASLSLLNLVGPGPAQGLLRSRVVRLCRLSQLPQEQMQELLARHARSERQLLVVLALALLLGLGGAVLSLREGDNGPDQPTSPPVLDSVIP